MRHAKLEGLRERSAGEQMRFETPDGSDADAAAATPSGAAPLHAGDEALLRCFTHEEQSRDATSESVVTLAAGAASAALSRGGSLASPPASEANGVPVPCKRGVAPGRREAAPGCAALGPRSSAAAQRAAPSGRSATGTAAADRGLRLPLESMSQLAGSTPQSIGRMPSNATASSHGAVMGANDVASTDLAGAVAVLSPLTGDELGAPALPEGLGLSDADTQALVLELTQLQSQISQLLAAARAPAQRSEAGE